jgi:hypothetical protein
MSTRLVRRDAESYVATKSGSPTLGSTESVPLYVQRQRVSVADRRKARDAERVSSTTIRSVSLATGSLGRQTRDLDHGRPVVDEDPEDPKVLDLGADLPHNHGEAEDEAAAPDILEEVHELALNVGARQRGWQST